MISNKENYSMRRVAIITAVPLLALVNFIAVLNLLKGNYVQIFNSAQVSALIYLYLNTFEGTWSLGVLIIFAGLCYVCLYIMKNLFPGLEFASAMEMILALPMALGELFLAFWLLLRGAKSS